MLYKEIIAVCFQIHAKHTSDLCGEIVDLLNVKLVVHEVTLNVFLSWCIYRLRSRRNLNIPCTAGGYVLCVQLWRYCSSCAAAYQ
jgi:hypothetical protein